MQYVIGENVTASQFMSINKLNERGTDKKRIVREETYGERINLIFGEGIGIVVTHDKTRISRQRERYNKIEERKGRRKWIRDSVRRKMRITSKNEGIKIFVGSQGNRNERFFFASRCCLFVDAKVERKVKRDGEKLVGALPTQ